MTSERILKAWLPVAVWLGVIAIESTEGMGASHTSLMLSTVIHWLHLHISWERVEMINHVLRKCGHFLGYGTLCLLFVRAWMLSLRPSLDGKPLLARAIALALFCTLCVASADEIHQKFLPGRTGTPVDVLLDMTGASLLVSAAASRFRRLHY